MTSVGNHVTSYDTGSKPFKHDETRGKWSSTGNFVLACIGHAFGLSNFSVLPVFIMMHGGVFFIIPYTIGLLVFALPVFFIQSFLGQFSSTGFISVFRISPLFKGIGYVILLLNITSASFFAVAAAYPLVYFFVSFSIDLPWMSCKHTWNSENCTEKFVNTTDEYGWYDLSWSTAEFFEIGIVNYDDEVKIAWPIFCGTMIIWIIVGYILYNGIRLIENVVKYGVFLTVSLLGIIFIRLAFLPGFIKGISWYFEPTIASVANPEAWFTSPYLSVVLLGSGWGTIVTLASYNNFKSDIKKCTILVCFSVTLITFFAAFTIFICEEYLYEYFHFSSYKHYAIEHVNSFLFIGFPLLFANIEASQLWSMIFFFMLFFCELLAVVTQTFVILTAVFDEYETLRNRKRETTIAVSAFLAIFSIVFTTNRGNDLLTVFDKFAGVSKMGICFLELIMVVWVYGRIRFQRDIEFMLSRTFASWKFQYVRFVSPFFALLVLLCYLVNGLLNSNFPMSITLVFLYIKFIPWIIIPGYAIYKLYTTTGSISIRFKRCTRPNDWAPSDPINKQKYDEFVGSSEISHQLVDMNDSNDEDDDVADNEEA